jgi:CheY-like chemotaxis protein
MSTRVLLAEQNDTIRGVAETVLRQNGFDVISVSNSDKLFEILEFSSPDLFLIDVGLYGHKGQSTWQRLNSEPKTAHVPLALLADEYDNSIGLPSANVVIRPFEPAELINQIRQVMHTNEASASVSTPLTGGKVDDDFLDSALGLDQLEVTDSEDMSKTGMVRTMMAEENTKIMGVGNFSKVTAETTKDSGKIESLMIRDEDSDIDQLAASKRPVKEEIDDGSLLLSDDQYGLTNPSVFQQEEEVSNHDYSWFINSMQSDNTAKGPQQTPSHSVKTDGSHSPDSLDLTGAAEMLNPHTLGPQAQNSSGPTNSHSPSVPSSPAGMDRFIDEFRQEVEKLGDDGPESILIPGDEPQYQPAASEPHGMVAVDSLIEPENASWEDKLENVTPEHMRIFTRELATRLADKIAGLILARIDQDKLLRLIKDELINEIRKKS